MKNTVFAGAGWAKEIRKGDGEVEHRINLSVDYTKLKKMEEEGTLERDVHGNVRLVIIARKDFHEKTQATHSIIIDSYKKREQQ